MNKEIFEYFETPPDGLISKQYFCLEKYDGSSVIIIADTLDIFSDPVTGIDENGHEVSIPQSDIKDIVKAKCTVCS